MNRDTAKLEPSVRHAMTPHKADHRAARHGTAPKITTLESPMTEQPKSFRTTRAEPHQVKATFKVVRPADDPLRRMREEIADEFSKSRGEAPQRPPESLEALDQSRDTGQPT